MRPQFAGYVDRPRVAGLIKGLVDMYRSPAVALRADNHLPRLMAQFLENAARNIPEYHQAGSSRGLSRTPPKIPSTYTQSYAGVSLELNWMGDTGPPLGEMSRFDAAPSEVLDSFVWDWFGSLDHVLPGTTY